MSSKKDNQVTSSSSNSSADSDNGEDIESLMDRDPLLDYLIGRAKVSHRVEGTKAIDLDAGVTLGRQSRVSYAIKSAFANSCQQPCCSESEEEDDVQPNKPDGEASQKNKTSKSNEKTEKKAPRKMTDTFANARGGSSKLNTGYHIPLVGFGTYKVTKENVLPAVDAALAAGYRMFDTAKYYLNEKELGDAFEVLLPKHKLTRQDIFITTKFFPESSDSVEKCRRYVKESLEDLKTNYIDMYLVHYPKPNDTDNEDEENAKYRKIAYEVLEEAKDANLIRSVGVSNYEIKHLEELKTYVKYPPCGNQVEYHPHFARVPLQQYCRNNGIFFQAFSSLARHEKALIEDPVVVELAKKHNTTVPLILLAWAVRQNVGIVPKSVTPTRIAENFKVIDVELSQEEIESLTKLDKGQHYIRCTGWLVK